MSTDEGEGTSGKVVFNIITEKAYTITNVKSSHCTHFAV